METLAHKFGLGDFQCFVINDASHAHTADNLIVNADQEQLEQVALEFEFELDKIPVDYNVLLVNTGDQNVLVDAGFGGPNSKLHRGLESLRLGPGSIGTIVITHSDRDHIGGILGKEGQPIFPNARYVMSGSAWEHWASAENRSKLATLNNWPEQKTRFAWETFSKIENLLVLVESEVEFLPGFRLITAVGHRCDHAVLNISSSGEQLLHISDAVVHPLLMAHRSWYSTYDSDPAQAVMTKQKLLDWCASEEVLIFGAHFPFPGIGYVQRQDDGWQWYPRKEPVQNLD